MSQLRMSAFAAAALLSVSGFAVRADSVWIAGTSSSVPAIKADGVKITAIKGDRLYYLTEGGVQTSKPLAQLPQINVDGEVAFNAAENAFAGNDFDTAITNYQSVLQSAAAKDWMASRAGERLVALGRNKNRYDVEVSAYCALLLKDPTSAAANKPSSPADHPQSLEAALATVQKAMGASQISLAQKSALLSLQLDINRARGDKAQITATLQQLVAVGAASPSDAGMLKVASANVDLDARQYTQAITTIEQNRALFTESDQQVDALFVLAQAHLGIDGDKTDPEKLKELALNYLRVVTFGSKLPDRPHVADSLYQAAQLEEKLGDKPAAILLYQQVIKDKAYAGTSSTAKAQAALTALGK